MSDIEIQELYAASYGRLLAQLIGVTGSVAEAEEVVQEAFVRGLHHPARLIGAGNPEAWLRTVAVNLARSRWRRAQRQAVRCGRWRVRWTATGEALDAALALFPPWVRPVPRPKSWRADPRKSATSLCR